jgi:cytochrome c2
MKAPCRLASVIPSIGLLAGAGCSGPATDPGLEAAVARGRTVWEAEECAACHGEDATGTPIGPTLERIGEHWSQHELERFLLDPTARLTDDARLAALTSEYDVAMPGVQQASADEVADLATFLIHGGP